MRTDDPAGYMVSSANSHKKSQAWPACVKDEPLRITSARGFVDRSNAQALKAEVIEL